MPKKADGNGIVKVLLVEDLPSDAELEMRELKAGLGECAFRVVETREAFVTTLKEFQPDLIVSDYKMPSFDGLSALRLAREFNPEIPFIIATGSMNEDTAVECIKAGADDYVIKEHLKRLSTAAINALKQAQERREKNRMQAALLESEEKFKYMFENSVIGSSLTKPNGEMQVNKSFCDMLGYSAAEMQGIKWQDITHPDDMYASQKMVDDLLSGKIKALRLKKRYFKKDGSIVWVDVSATLRRDKDGNPQYFMTTLSNITDRVEALQALQDSERQFRSIFEVALLGIAQVDPGDFKFIRCNETYCRMLGYTMAEITRLHFPEITHPEDRAKDMELYQKTLRGEINGYQYEKRNVRKDGSIIWVNLNVALARDEQGNILSSVSMVEDITQRKMDEEELLLLQRAMEQSPVLVLITNTDGKIEYVNQRFTEVTGYNLSELIGKQSNIFMDEKHRTEEYRQLITTLKSGATWQGEFQNRKKNGELYWERSTIAPVRNKDGIITSYIDMKQDITEKKQAESELQASESKFRSVIETSADAIVLTDPHGIVIEWNPAAERILRTPRQAAIGQSLWDVQFNAYTDTSDAPDAYERLKKSVLDIRKTGKGAILNQLREQELRFKDGSVITIESIAFIFDKSADGWHVGSITRDVSERKKKEEEVRQSETKFRTLFTNMVSGASVDEVIYKGGKVVDYRILDINPAYERILGIQREKVVGKLASEIYAPHPIPYLEAYAQVAETGKAQEFEAFFPPSAKYLHITASSPALGRFSTVFSDITERKQAAEALQQKIVELEHFHDVTVDRELRMIEMKREINALLKAAGQNEKFKGVN